MPKAIKSLFGKPRCSKHGCVVYESGYMYGQYRCPMCDEEQKEKKVIAGLQRQIDELKEEIKRQTK